MPVDLRDLILQDVQDQGMRSQALQGQMLGLLLGEHLARTRPSELLQQVSLRENIAGAREARTERSLLAPINRATAEEQLETARATRTEQSLLAPINRATAEELLATARTTRTERMPLELNLLRAQVENARQAGDINALTIAEKRLGVEQQRQWRQEGKTVLNQYQTEVDAAQTEADVMDARSRFVGNASIRFGRTVDEIAGMIAAPTERALKRFNPDYQLSADKLKRTLKAEQEAVSHRPRWDARVSQLTGERNPQTQESMAQALVSDVESMAVGTDLKPEDVGGSAYTLAKGILQAYTQMKFRGIAPRDLSNLYPQVYIQAYRSFMAETFNPDPEAAAAEAQRVLLGFSQAMEQMIGTPSPGAEGGKPKLPGLTKPPKVAPPPTGTVKGPLPR